MATAQTGVFLYLESLVAVVVAVFIPGESLTIPLRIGGGIILPGICLVNR